MSDEQTASTSERGQRGISRVLAKLAISIEEGNYYEAHQMYRTLYFRYTSNQKFDDCLDLLYSGALQLLAKNQQTSAADLGLLLIDTLEKRGQADDNESWIDRLVHIIGKMSVHTIERETLIYRAVKWSGDMSGNSLGHPFMHKLIGQVFWAEQNTALARHHYLLCRDGNTCGRMLIKISVTKGYINETDLFIAQAVLQQLCLKDRKTAEDTFVAYTTNHPRIKQSEPPFALPLLNFIFFLFRCIDSKRLDTFNALRDMYKPALSRDPAFEKYLVKVGVHFFGIAPPPTSEGGGVMGGMFGDLFSRLFQGFDDEDRDEELPIASNVRNNGQHANELD